MRAVMPSGRTETARHVAAAAAAASAALYFLIGFKVLSVGEAASTPREAAPDIFAFGAMTGIAFTVTALLLYVSRSRRLWVAVAILQAIVLVGYVAVSNVRTPPYEVWGLLIKGLQLVILGSVAYLLLRSRARA